MLAEMLGGGSDVDGRVHHEFGVDTGVAGPIGHTHGDMTLWEVLHQGHVGPHLGPVLDGDRFQDLDACTDLHAVTDGGTALA